MQSYKKVEGFFGRPEEGARKKSNSGKPYGMMVRDWTRGIQNALRYIEGTYSGIRLPVEWIG